MPVQHISTMKTIEGEGPTLNQYNQIPGLAFTMQTVSKGANYTLLPEDSGKVFLATTGAVTFTLPAVTLTGFMAWFVNGVDANMTVASAENDNIITDGDAAADSVAFSTASHKIGGCVCLVSNGTNWLILSVGNASAVPTYAT